MPAEAPSNPVLATMVTAGAVLVLLFGAGRDAAQPAPARTPRSKDRSPQPADAPQATGAERGRQATHPKDIPPRGWWDILKRTAGQVSDDRVLTEAAGITFYTLLALFPAIGAMISIYGLFAEPATISEHLATVAGFVPGGGMEIIEEQIKRITAKGDGALGLGAVIGLATSLWSANQAMKAVVDALNVVYDEKEQRSFFLRLALTMAFTVGGILFVLLAIGAVVVLPVALKFVGLGWLETALSLARWPLMLAAIGVFLALLYRYGPSRDRAQWRWVSWGSAFAAVAWVLGSAGFSWYVTNFGNYNETYGSLGAVIGFMTWIWISATVVLAGGELDAEMEHQTARDTTTGPERPMGERGAKMADTVA